MIFEVAEDTGVVTLILLFAIESVIIFRFLEVRIEIPFLLLLSFNALLVESVTRLVLFKLGGSRDLTFFGNIF